MQCYKCKGTGFIQGFAHVNQGRCFQCNGSGVLPEASKKNVGYSKQFLNQFYHTGNFREIMSERVSGLERLFRIGNEHPTAESWVYFDSSTNSFIMCAPVCMRNDWTEVPADDLAQYLKHTKKVRKDAIIIDLFKQWQESTISAEAQL